jgi:glycosyltransferase involved in cell wall biosynthesis
MRILWVTRTRVVGGAERATLVLARCLRARGHQIEVLSRPASPLVAAADSAGLPVRSARWGVAGVRAAIRAAAPDIVLVTTIDDWVPACLSASPGPGGLVLVRHMALPVSWPLRWLADRRAGAIVAVSTAVRDQLTGRAGIRPGRLHVIANPSRFPVRTAVPRAAERAAARDRFGLPARAHWVAYLGGSTALKGPRDALAAVRDAAAALGPIGLVVCGRRDAQAPPWHGAGDWVIDLGEVAAVDDLLTAVDAVVVPTHRALGEALPLTVIEAMACGTPVIAYAVGGIAEALGETGFLVEPDDVGRLGTALREVLADRPRAEAMATRALERARQRFDPERIADRFEALFAKLTQPSERDAG